MKADQLSPSALRDLQESKLRSLINYAYHRVSYYRKLFDRHGIHPDDIQTLEDLQKIPVTTKSELIDLPPSERISDDPDLGKLVEQRSSGSTGTPFAVSFDKYYVFKRNLRFLRGLYSCGYLWPQKLMLITGVEGKTCSRLKRWHYASTAEAPEHLYAQYQTCRPDVLYGCVTPLRLILEYAMEHNRPLHRVRSIITTAETLDHKTRGLIQQGFQATVYDFYGMTEMGLIGWECSAHNGYHLSSESIITELSPVDGSRDKSHLIFTKLELRAMPLIRFASGDLAHGQLEAGCQCGSKLPILRRVEGRMVDTLSFSDGRLHSPYEFTCKIETIREVKRYKVLQEPGDRLRILVETWEPFSSGLEQEIRAAIGSITGSTVVIDVEPTERIPHVPGRKFRLVESIKK